MNNINISTFLRFGYFLDYKNPNINIDFSGTDKSKYVDCSENELINIGTSLWFNAIQKQFSPYEKHLVPLSGGIDSRAILATLLEFTNASNIYTYTFGTTNSLDYEIGTNIAKEIGTKHLCFPLNDYDYNVNELIDVSKRSDNQTIVFLHPSVSIMDKEFCNHNIWSGAIIDVFFGRHTHKVLSNDLIQGMNNFINENIFVSSIDMSICEKKDFYKYIDFDYSVENILQFEHIIDLLNRQIKFIAPHVLLKGFNYKTLLDKELIDFSLSINESFHYNQNLYKKMFLKSFPELFSYPIKNNFGLPLNANKFSITYKKLKLIFEKKTNKNFIDPRINYIDFKNAILFKINFKELIYSNIMDLKKRNIIYWVDIDKIWNENCSKKIDHTNALLALASLEIHLKAGKKL